MRSTSHIRAASEQHRSAFAGLPLREPHPSSRQRRPGHERLALKPGGDALQLVGRCLRAGEVAARDLDLDLRVEQASRSVALGRRPPPSVDAAARVSSINSNSSSAAKVLVSIASSTE